MRIHASGGIEIHREDDGTIPTVVFGENRIVQCPMTMRRDSTADLTTLVGQTITGWVIHTNVPTTMLLP